MRLVPLVDSAMLIEGILAIQAGTSPRVVEAVLLSQLPPKVREAAEAKDAKAA